MEWVINPYTLYRNTAGEIEARDVSNRATMTVEQREANFPESMKPNEDVVFADDGVSYNTSKTFKEQVAETLHGSKTERSHVYIGETTSILKQVGLNPKPMLMTRGHIRDINHPKDGVNSKYHGLSEEIINELPNILDYPAIIFDAIWPEHKGKTYVLSEKLDADGNPILIAIKPDGYSQCNKLECNFVLTMFGKDGVSNLLNKLANHSGEVLYMDNKRTQELLKVAGRQLPAKLSKLKFNHIIHKTKNVVNTKSKKSIDSDIQFSSPVASTDTKTENDIKISSNKAKNYYDRYSKTAKKDIGKILGIPKSRLGVIESNLDTLAGEYFHNGKISDESKNALFEKAWKEGIVIDDTNADLAKDLRKELKSSKLYISPDEAKDIPDFGAWRKSQIGNMMVSTANGYPVDSKYIA